MTGVLVWVRWKGKWRWGGGERVRILWKGGVIRECGDGGTRGRFRKGSRGLCERRGGFGSGTKVGGN